MEDLYIINVCIPLRGTSHYLVFLVINATLVIKWLANHIYVFNFELVKYLGYLKSYVKNRMQPKGSIVEGYLAKECLTFCSRYLDKIKTRFNRVGHVNDDFSYYAYHQELSIFPNIG